MCHVASKKAVCGFRYKQVHHVMSAECPANRCLRRLHSVDSAGNQCIMVYLSRLPSVDWAAKSVIFYVSYFPNKTAYIEKCVLFILSFIVMHCFCYDITQGIQRYDSVHDF